MGSNDQQFEENTTDQVAMKIALGFMVLYLILILKGLESTEDVGWGFFVFMGIFSAAVSFVMIYYPLRWILSPRRIWNRFFNWASVKLRKNGTQPFSREARIEKGYDTRYQSRPDESFSDGGEAPDWYSGEEPWEGTYIDGDDNRKIAETRIKLGYRDGSGNLSDRVVRVGGYDPHHHTGMMIGYCELREATRTFRFSRVREAVDLETGEFIEDLRTYFDNKYAVSPYRTRDELEEDYFEVLLSIFFVAKADGYYREPEKRIIRDYCRELVNNRDLPDMVIDPVFRYLEPPSLHRFKIAVGRTVDHTSVDNDRFYEVCRDIVGTQDKVTPGEREALDYIKKRM
jgi:hypothetical protein